MAWTSFDNSTPGGLISPEINNQYQYPLQYQQIRRDQHTAWANQIPTLNEGLSSMPYRDPRTAAFQQQQVAIQTQRTINKEVGPNVLLNVLSGFTGIEFIRDPETNAFTFVGMNWERLILFLMLMLEVYDIFFNKDRSRVGFRGI